MEIRCACCRHPVTDWTGYYCIDTQVLKRGATPAAHLAHNKSRLWLCNDCSRLVLAEILQTQPRCSWDWAVEAARLQCRSPLQE